VRADVFTGKVNFAFVVALQMVRAVTVLFIGPPLAKFIASHTGDRQEGERTLRHRRRGDNI